MDHIKTIEELRKRKNEFIAKAKQAKLPIYLDETQKFLIALNHYKNMDPIINTIVIQYQKLALESAQLRIIEFQNKLKTPYLRNRKQINEAIIKYNDYIKEYLEEDNQKKR